MDFMSDSIFAVSNETWIALTLSYKDRAFLHKVRIRNLPNRPTGDLGQHHPRINATSYHLTSPCLMRDYKHIIYNIMSSMTSEPLRRLTMLMCIIRLMNEKRGVCRVTA